MCTITGLRPDLVQGGMEVPCIYHFSGNDGDVTKVEKLLQISNPSESLCIKQESDSEHEPKRVKVHVDMDLDEPRHIYYEQSDVWVMCESVTLYAEDRIILSRQEDLNDKHINFGQCLIKMQFLNIHGLKSTLEISKPTNNYAVTECQGPFIQVIHTGNHWIVASNIGGANEVVTVYDSLYKVVDEYTHNLLKRLFKNIKIKVFLLQPQLQTGVHDCGLFALAFCVSLAMGEDLSNVNFNQDMIRKHLEECFDKKHLYTFPTLS